MNHQYFLSQLEFGIKHLPPTIPEDEAARIQKLFSDLKELGPEVDENQIKSTMIEIGKIEWPYRQAYSDLVMACCSHTQHDLFMKNLSQKTKKKYTEIGGEDASVQEVVHSAMFEEKLSPEERYEVQESALDARLQMHEFMKGQIESRPKEYEAAVVKAKKMQKEMEDAIDVLSSLSKIDADWGPEIEGKVDQMQLAWSISERDVTLDDVNKEIEYWKGILGGTDVEGAEL